MAREPAYFLAMEPSQKDRLEEELHQKKQRRAVFGLMAASVVGVGQRGVNPLGTGLGVTFAINLLFTLAVPGVSVGGHFGGAIIGALVGSLSLAPRSWKVPTWASVVVPVAVSIACVAVAVAFVTG